MAGHPELHASPLRHLSLSLIGQIQSQTMSHAKFIFLVALVVFFVALFVAAYLWMRRPDFGQKGGRAIPSASAEPAAPAEGRVSGERRTDDGGVVTTGASAGGSAGR